MSESEVDSGNSPGAAASADEQAIAEESSEVSAESEPVREFEQRGESRILAVVVHSYTGARRHLREIVDVIKEQLPHADIYAPQYRANLLSNTDLVVEAKDIAVAIDKYESALRQRNGGKPYEEVILIGHSLGALLVRKAYLFARGMSQDTDFHRLGLRMVPRDWPSRVRRIILFAGMNRGWALEQRPDYMSWPVYLWCRFLMMIVWLLPFGKMILGVRRGEPFVVNLRLQWMQLERSHPDSMPLTVQLLGTNDTMVQKHDTVDLESGLRFAYLEMPGAGHLNITRFSPRRRRSLLRKFREIMFGPWHKPEKPAYLKQRRTNFVSALTTDPTTIQSEFAPERRVRPEAKHAVFIMHGIRDRGDVWVNGIEETIRTICSEKGEPDPGIQRSSYGFFPMLPFLLRYRRQEHVRWFADKYTDLVALCPNAEIGFIGHSNGTYLASCALDRYELIRFDNVAFAGSVVATHYDWETRFRDDRVKRLRNFRGHGDWVVAIFPHLFEQLPRKGKTRGAEIGSGGFNGFDFGPAKRYEVILKGGHRAGTQPAIHQALARFALDGEVVDLDEQLTRNRPAWWASFLSRFCAVIWLILATIVVAIGCFVVTFLGNTVAPGFLIVLYVLAVGYVLLNL